MALNPANTPTPVELEALAAQYLADEDLNEYNGTDISGDKADTVSGINGVINDIIEAHSGDADVVDALENLKLYVANTITTNIPSAMVVLVSDVITDKIIPDVEAGISASLPHLCGLCAGQKVIPANRIAGNSIDNSDLITCPTCNGEGRTAAQFVPQIVTVQVS